MKDQKKEITDKEYSLVRKITYEVYNKYCPAGQHGQVTKQDLYHFGITGLLDAAQRFNKKHKVPWLAFASIRVRGEIIDNIRKAPLLRIPQVKYKEISMLKKKKNEFEESGREFIPEELARELEWDVDKLQKVEKLSLKVISIDTGNTAQTNNEVLLSEIAVSKQSDIKNSSLEKTECPESDLLNKELSNIIQKCLEALKNPEERLVLVSRILKGMKLKQVAIILSCSIESVRQKQVHAQENMKTCLAENGWDSK